MYLSFSLDQCFVFSMDSLENTLTADQYFDDEDNNVDKVSL